MKTYQVTATALHLRKGPSLWEAPIHILPKNTFVHALGESPNGSWVHGRITTIGKTLTGWCSKKFLQEVPHPWPQEHEPPWLPIALGELGVQEVGGTTNHPRVLEYLQSCELLAPSLQQKDETPWCAAFVNWCMEQAGIEGTNSARARDWLHWGEAQSTPTRGCVVVFSRGAGGHVGFYLGETDTHIEVLGGNQRNAVNVLYYSKHRVLGYRSLPLESLYCSCYNRRLA